MVANINNFGVVNFYENNAPKQESSKKAEPVCEDITPVQEEKPDNGNDHFPYLTKKCFEQKQVDAVEAEIQAAKTGTAEDMWRTLWDNENMGYLNVKHINATSLYHDIEKWYGKLPYKERNFRDARNKR